MRNDFRILCGDGLKTFFILLGTSWIPLASICESLRHRETEARSDYMAYPSSSDPAGEKPGNDTTSLSRKCQTSAEWTPWENSIKRASLLLFPTENPLVGRAGRASRLGRGCGKERRGGHKDEGLVADKGVDQTNKHFREDRKSVV